MNITILVSYLIAIAVPVFAIYLIFALDLFGTGKGSTVLICLAWGAVGAFGLAYVLNTNILKLLMANGVSYTSGYTTITTLVAPMLEEMLKAAILIYLVRRPRFRYVVDGAIYGFGVGIGFAVSENIFYLSNEATGAGLMLAISRVLSTSLMHATASALVGISLGNLRRSQNSSKFLWAFGGIILAMALHLIFNNVVAIKSIEGTVILLVGIGIGIGGGVLIAYLIGEGITEEKRRFQQTLGLSVGVSSGERKAVQQLGGSAIEDVLKDLGDLFGDDKIDKIRRLLVIQANIGILTNNLSSPVSDRLRVAWEQEIATQRAETDQIRNDLGVYVMGFVRGVFPPDEEEITKSLSQEFTKSDPTVIHSFDVFMTASKLAGSIPPEQLAANADLLHSVEFFKDVSLPDLENLSRAILSRTYTDGQIVFNEGDEGDAMYLITDGHIDLYTHSDGEERLLRTMHKGEVVGDLALLDGQPRSAQARAGASLKVLMLRREQFIMFMQSRPQVILAVLQYLARRVREVTEVVETSIAWASNIAAGKYEEARKVGALAPSANMPLAQPDAIQPPAAIGGAVGGTVGAAAAVGVGIPIALRTAEGPARIGGAFSMIASALEQREQEMYKKLTEEGLTALDMAELENDDQRTVLKFLVSDSIAATQGIPFDLLQAKLDKVRNMADVIASLDNLNWLIKLGNEPNLRYKANLRRKRGNRVAQQFL